MVPAIACEQSAYSSLRRWPYTVRAGPGAMIPRLIRVSLTLACIPPAGATIRPSPAASTLMGISLHGVRRWCSCHHTVWRVRERESPLCAYNAPCNRTNYLSCLTIWTVALERSSRPARLHLLFGFECGVLHAYIHGRVCG